jgi:prevent-host-death family protein
MTIYSGHMPAQRRISASEFKSKCLALLDEVAETKATLVITKRGKAVAHVSPAEEPRSLLGTVEFLVSDDELIQPLYEDWEPTLPT